jgi:hypothetical protein
MSYEIDQRVRVIADIYEPPDGDSPGGYCAKKGDVVVIRSVQPSGKWPLSVSHEDRTDGNTFAIGLDEVEPTA